MPKSLQNIAAVATATMGSRLLGLGRDVLIFSLLGMSAVNSAFIFAFTVPNLFRRLLGEGALTSALVPVFSGRLKDGGLEQSYRFLNQVLSWTVLLLAGLIVLGCMALAVVFFIPELPERWYLGAGYGIVLMPYMALICLAALIGAVLNVLGRFTVVALSAVWLNLAMILSLGGFGYWLSGSLEALGWWLCLGVIVGGLLQLGVPGILLMRQGWRPVFDFRWSPPLREVAVLFLPGVAGAAIFQINLLVTRLLAFGLEPSAVAALYLANRLVELPLGVFTIAVATVVFPNLALLAAANDRPALGFAFRQGLRLILAISIPASVGLFLWSTPILRLLFEWGIFGGADVAFAAPVLSIYALALPFYSLATFATRGFHSMKDTRTPVRVAVLVFGVNLVLSVVLMVLMGVLGLALANLASSVVHAVCLSVLLGRKEPVLRVSALGMGLPTVGAAAVIMAVFCLLIEWPVVAILGAGKMGAGVLILVGVPLAMGIYGGVLKILRFPELAELIGLLRSRIRPGEQVGRE